MRQPKDYSSRSRCPSPKELADFSNGKVASVAADAIAAHLEACERCRSVLEECGRELDPIVEDLRDCFQGPTVDEEEIDRVVARVEALRGDIDRATLQTESAKQEVGPGKRNGVQFRCPFCHELDAVDNASSGSKVCPHCGGQFSLALDDVETHRVQPGARIANYEILAFLGEGSFGAVWKSRDIYLDRLVALKLPRRGQIHGENFDAFVHEARLTAQVHHSGIVHVYEVGAEEDTVYLASELIDGQSLDVSLSEHRYSAGEAAKLSRDIADAVQAAHAAGMVHRDLKPANILLDEDGTPHIADFGLAKHVKVDVVATAEGKILGTPVYMSPEQAIGDASRVDERSDVYSLGVILYELLTGRPPFKGDIHILVSKILLDDPTPPRELNPSLPRDLETICLKCLEKKRSSRYQSAAELCSDLQCFLEGRPIQARPVGRLGRFWRWTKRRPAMAALSAIALLACLIAFTALAVGHWRATSALEVAEENLYYHSITSAEQRWMINDPSTADAILDQCPADFRDFEWGFLKHLVRTPVRRLRNGDGCVTYSPDGETLATGEAESVAVKVWDPRSRERLQRLMGHGLPPTAIAYHPTEALLVTAGGRDRTVRIWDAARGRQLRVFRGYGGRVDYCAFSPNGSAVIAFDQTHRFTVHHAATGEPLHDFSLATERVRDVAFSPTKPILVAASGRRGTATLSIYDYENQSLVETISASRSAVGSLAFSADGTRLAVGESRRAIQIWQIEPTLELLATIPGPVSPHCHVAFDAKGERVAAEALDGTICVWETQRGQMLLTLRGHSRPVGDIAFSPDGRQLAAVTGRKEVCLWDLGTEQGSVGYDGGSGVAQDVAVSSNGQWLAAALGDGTARVWDRKSGELVQTFAGNGETTWSVAFSPDNGRLAVAGEDRIVKIYDLTTGKLTLNFTGHIRPLRCVAFSPNGQSVASAGNDSRIHVWDVRTGEVHQTFRLRGPSVRTLAFHPDGKRLAAGGASPDVSVFDLQSGQTIWTEHGDSPVRVWDVTFSPDGDLLAIARGDGTIRLRKSEDGALLETFGDLVEDRPVSLAFSPNGNRLVSATARTAVSLWDPSTGRHVLSISRHPATAGAAAFAPDGQAVVTGDVYGTVRLWPTIDSQFDAPGDH